MTGMRHTSAVLARHADRRLHGPSGEERHQCGGHGDPGGRTVLRDRPGRHVHVEATVERGGFDAEVVRVPAHVGERDLRRLLHHVAELAGQGETGIARHRGRLDEEHVATGAGHGQPGRDARDGAALRRFGYEPGTPQVPATFPHTGPLWPRLLRATKWSARVIDWQFR